MEYIGERTCSNEDEHRSESIQKNSVGFVIFY